MFACLGRKLIFYFSFCTFYGCIINIVMSNAGWSPNYFCILLFFFLNSFGYLWAHLQDWATAWFWGAYPQLLLSLRTWTVPLLDKLSCGQQVALPAMSAHGLQLSGADTNARHMAVNGSFCYPCVYCWKHGELQGQWNLMPYFACCAWYLVSLGWALTVCIQVIPLNKVLSFFLEFAYD